MKHPWDRRLGFWWLAEEYPDQPAVVGCPSGVTLTFSELAGRAHRLVHGLRAQGLGAGDIFAYALPNDVDMLCWQLAANEGGFQSIALNPALSGAEIQRIVDHSEAAAMILHHDFADRVDQMSGTGSIKLRVSVGATWRASCPRSPRRGPADDGAAGPPAGSPHRLLVGHHRAAQGRRPAGPAQHRPFGGRRHGQELRPCVPVPAPHRGAPGLGRHAPWRMPGLLHGRVECRPGARDPRQVRPREDLAAIERYRVTTASWCRPSSSASSACHRR